MDKTTIEVSREVWRELNQQKQSPGETFDDVLRRQLRIEHDRDDVEEKDVVAFVRENQPVSKSDIIDEFDEEIASKGIKGESWWTRHARPQLDEAGAEFTRNVGWQVDR